MATPPSRSVVIVDDDNIMRELLRALLNAAGIAVVGEAGHRDRLEALLRRQRPDVVLLDINLPGQSGLEVLEWLRATHPQVKVVMISADATAANVQDAMRKGATGFIVKPFATRTVLDSIERVFAA
jgi:two-component system chemotaxis response regulator CheY